MEQERRTETPTEKRIRELLDNPAFIRVSRGFEIYRDILEREKKHERRKEIMKRMHNLQRDAWAYQTTQEEKTKKISKKREQQPGENDPAEAVFETILRNAEEGKFDKTSFAKLSVDKYLNSWLQELWKLKIGKDETTGFVFVSEALAYFLDEDGTLSLHIPPNSLKTEQVIPKIIEGMTKLAQSIKEGKIAPKTIQLKSWLLNKTLEPIIRGIFAQHGPKLEFEDVDDAEEGTWSIQKLALVYNGRSLRDYLQENKKPAVRKLEIEPQDFVDALAV